MKSLRSFTYSSAVALLLSASAVSAQESPFKFEFHGFVTGSMYYQDQVFANAQGQGLLLASPTLANQTGSATVPKSDRIIGGDIRNSRFSFGVTGPGVLGGTPRAYLEFDLFGPNGAGTFGDQQNLPRIRVAIAELKLGTTLVQVGQQNQLVVPQIPASIAHIANPIPFGAGLLGWRTPGVRLVHSLPAGPAKLELAVEVVKNKWADAALNMGGACSAFPCQQGAPSQANPQTVSTAEVGDSMPMIQGRVKADGKAGEIAYSAYVVGVYHTVDFKGFGESNAAAVAALPKQKVNGYVVEAGGRIVFAPVTVAANYYIGKANGNMLGAIVQFGDIADQGGWVNVGVNVSKEFSIWGLYGLARPDEDDVRKWGGTRLKNDMFGGMVRYAAGGYQIGVEGYQIKTTYSTGATTDDSTDGLQIIGSVGYFF